MKYLKVMFSTKSRYSDYEYKIDEVNIANEWNPFGKTPKEIGGFNFSNDKNIIRWLHNGDTIYDVEIPEDAEVISVINCATPKGVFRSNKIIIKNPRKVDDDMALKFYENTVIPEGAFPKALAGVAVMDYYNTANRIFSDKVSKENISYYLSEWDDFISKRERKDCNETVKEIDAKLREMYMNTKVVK